MPSNKKSNKTADSGNRGNSNRETSTPRESGSNSGAKINDALYNVITVLHEKSKGLEAYDKYEQDLQGNEEILEIFQEIRQNDEDAVQRLRECLQQLVSAESESEEEAA